MKKNSEPNFENQLNRLEEILEILDNDTTPLEEMLKVYEEGIILTKELRKFLDNAELKITELGSKE